MRIAFVFPIQQPHSKDKPLTTPMQVNLGISYISSLLKLKGHLTRLFVLSRNNRSQIERALDEFDPQLICFTALATTYYLVQDFARNYKVRKPNVFLIAGGCHVSLNPERVIADPFDAICIGEGEYPTSELATQLEQGLSPSQIPNLWINKGTAIERNPPRPFMGNLDSLPFPDRQIWEQWIRYSQEPPAILIGRGCPFNCTYCCNHRLARLASGQYNRFRSPQNILEEVKQYLIDYPETKEVYFETETIGTNPNFVLQLCSALEQFNHERVQPVAFSVNLRITPNMNYGTLFEALHRANFKAVEIGLESGSERIRREVLRRIYSNSDIIKAVTFARRYGLKVNLYVMIGLPHETPEDFQQTVELTRQCQPDIVNLSIFYPYPGTELASLCEEDQLLDRRVDIERVRERRQPVLTLPDFPQKQVIQSYIWFEYNVFRGYRPLPKLLIRVLFRKVTTSSALTRFFNFWLDIPLFYTLKQKLIG